MDSTYYGEWDENLFTNYYWSGYDGTNPSTQVADLGSSKTFNHFHADVVRHAAEWNPGRWRLDGSNVSASGPWEPICDDLVFDPGGTGWNIDLPANPTYRWVKFRADPFGGTFVIVDDARIGFITGQGTEPGGGDTEAPTVTLVQPSSGAEVSGTVFLGADADDNVGVDHVEFYANGVLLNSDSSSPYEFLWTTTYADAGNVTLVAKAYDAAGNSTVSDPVLVTVGTPAPPPSDYWGVLSET
jgi:hypothetical protein